MLESNPSAAAGGRTNGRAGQSVRLALLGGRCELSPRIRTARYATNSSPGPPPPPGPVASIWLPGPGPTAATTRTRRTRYISIVRKMGFISPSSPRRGRARAARSSSRSLIVATPAHTALSTRTAQPTTDTARLTKPFAVYLRSGRMATPPAWIGCSGSRRFAAPSGSERITGGGRLSKPCRRYPAATREWHPVAVARIGCASATSSLPHGKYQTRRSCWGQLSLFWEPRPQTRRWLRR